MSESFGHEEEEDQFFDSRDDISSASSSCPGSPAGNSSLSDEKMLSNWALNGPYPAFWLKDPDSVRTRRSRFMRLMGLDQMNGSHTEPESEEEGSKVGDEDQPDTGRASIESGAVLRSSSPENTCSTSSRSSDETSIPFDDESFEETFMCRIKNLDDGTIFIANELGKDGKLRSLREIGSNRTLGPDEFEKILGSSSIIKKFMRKEVNASIRPDKSPNSKFEKAVTSRRIGWLKRLGAVANVVDMHRKEIPSKGSSSTSGRIKVHRHRKQQKELSAIFNIQDIKAHDGAILTMKFSPDGQYLATGGEDGIVRVWRVSKSRGFRDFCIPKDDPSCVYFMMNHSSELAAAHSDRVKKIKPRELNKISNSACAVIPHEVFHLSTEPIHEFCGHDGNVLDLSWSTSKYLLSSSMDKTVRMWQIGSQNCLKVFPHRNYVTCVQFNPIEENFFVSGSIDGKVRIWDIPGCKVVHWADAKEIVTAVCYRPDGKGVVVGTLTGTCRFYDIQVELIYEFPYCHSLLESVPHVHDTLFTMTIKLDNHLEIDFHLSVLQNTRSFKRITGFQFCPTNPRKLMVVSADSKIHIFDGADVVAKFKGLRSTGGQLSASFTADGQHIISSGEDSNVYIWNNHDLDMHISNPVKSNSFERFLSSNVMVAIPWSGFQSRHLTPDSTTLHLQQETSCVEVGCKDCNCHVDDTFGLNSLYLPPYGGFVLSHESFSGFVSKGSVTWPEEKLPSDSSASTFCRSHYKFLKTPSQYRSHAWGQVIVTAGRDGCIRSYQNFGLPLYL